MRLPSWESFRWRAQVIRMRLRSQVLVFRLPAAPTTASALRVVPAELDDSSLVPYDEKTLTGNRANGWTLYGWYEDGLPVSFAWARVAQEHWITEIGAGARAQTEVGWIVHCVTPEHQRGRGHYPRLIREVAARLTAEESYIYCTPNNRASRRGIEKAGFELVGMISQTLGHRTCTAAGLTLIR